MSRDPSGGAATAPRSQGDGPQRAPGAGAGTVAPASGAARSPGFLARHRRAATSALVGAVIFGFVYYVVPQIVGLGPTLRLLRGGNPRWLAVAVPAVAASMAAYIVLFRGVFFADDERIGWSASYQISMAGAAATKLFAAAGAGGLALTVWALRESGMASATVAQDMWCFEILNYAVYMLALVIGGFGLWIGLFGGAAPFGLTFVPGLFGLLVIAAVVSMQWLGAPLERFLLGREQHSHGRVARWWKRAAAVPRALQDGLRSAFALVRGGNRSWLAALPAWGFEIATLWACFRAFGQSPPAAVLITGFFVGTLANVLPLPGGVGGVEGGMIGAFIGFGVNGSLAVLAVLAFRTISSWIPLLPEGIAYLQLRHTVGDWRQHPADGVPRGVKEPGTTAAVRPA